MSEDLSPLSVLSISIPCAILFSWIAARMGYYRLTTQYHQFVPLPQQHFFWIFLFFLSIQLVIVPGIFVLAIGVITGSFSSEMMQSTLAQAWGNVMLMFSAFFGVWGISKWGFPTSHEIVWRRHFSSSKSYAAKSFLIGIGTWIICFPIILSMMQILTMMFDYFELPKVDQLPVQSVKMIRDYPVLLYLTITGIVFLVPVVEELLFRGYFQTWLRRYFSIKWAIFLSALVFTLFHLSLSLGVNNLQYLIPLFILACFLGFLYERQQSLWAPIGLHALFNAVSALMILLDFE